MTLSLLDTLNQLRTDPTVVIRLYGQLFEANFLTMVRKGTENSLEKMEFLTYDTIDGLRELPLFTSDKFVINNLSPDALTIKLGGQLFWTRLLDIIETGKCEVAINPRQTHSIRLTKEIILGMIANHGKLNSR